MMLTIYYDPLKKKWYHTEKSAAFTWGKNRQLLSFTASISQTALPFKAAHNKYYIGPLIGILTGAPIEGTSFIGNTKRLYDIQKVLQAKGLISIIFTAKGIEKENINGFMYSEHYKNWIMTKTPLPNIVYNKLPSRAHEMSDEFQLTKQFLQQKKIPYFNPFFFSKWETSQALMNNKFLNQFLPYTVQLTDKQSLWNMLNAFETVYVKRSKGRMGEGIYQLSKLCNDFLLVKSSQAELQYKTIDEFWTNFMFEFTQHEYIVQQAIESDTYQNKRYDIRLLAHAKNETYVISGIGVRLAGEQNVTTHVPNGGKVIPYEFIQNRINEELLKKMVHEVGIQLSNEFAHFIGEFSIDIGKSANDRFYIYEVNSKPMIFDEETIKKQGLENLSLLLETKAKMD